MIPFQKTHHPRHGTPHVHRHGPVGPSSRRTRLILVAVLGPIALATLIAMIVLWPGRVTPSPDPPGSAQDVRAQATVVAVTEQQCPSDVRVRGRPPRCGQADVKITDGPGTGTVTTVDLPQGPGAPVLHVGDDIVVLHAPDAVPGGRAYTVVDQQRAKPMIWMLVLSVAVILLFGRWRGLTSLAGLAISFAVLLLFIIPAIVQGESPLLVAVVGASAIMFAALYLTHGVNVHTSVAVAGTVASLVLTGVLGVVFTAAMHLTGIAGDDDSYLSVVQGNIDMRGLLLAGIIIGALGVLDDVTVTQAATVDELARGGTGSRLEVYRAAIRIGRAHVASAVNTIVLAYAGGSLPLLLVVATGTQPLSQVLTSEYLAQEILRGAVGTIGLVASVPITTALAALVTGRNRPVPQGGR